MRSPRRNRWWKALRGLADNQTRLWDRVLDDLEPWRDEGPLRWRGGHLQGRLLPGQQEPAR